MRSGVLSETGWTPSPVLRGNGDVLLGAGRVRRLFSEAEDLARGRGLGSAVRNRGGRHSSAPREEEPTL